MLKMLMLVYNEAVDMEVMEALAKCSIENYTKLTGIFGKGSASGAHLGTDVWPGKNNLLYIACEEAQARQALLRIKEMRSAIGKEGIKAFLLPLDELT